MSLISFNEEAHVYTRIDDGVVVPSVTQILKLITEHEYRFVDRDVMERAARLGTAVHKMIELDIAGDLDEESLSEPLVPYLQQWRQFRSTSGFKAEASELRVYSKKFGYAGTLDIAGTLRGRKCIIDAKRCAMVPKSAGPQTSAYEAAYREERATAIDRFDRYALHMTPQKWSLVQFTDPNDYRVFLSALTIFNFTKEKAHE
jgi:hypothetical protein